MVFHWNDSLEQNTLESTKENTAESAEDMLIWVDENDQVIGAGPKMKTHEIAQLHRAFSVFLFDEKTEEILLQQRAFSKYHSGGLWTNTCCSHPRCGETLKEAIQKRLPFELGLSLEEMKPCKNPLPCGHFQYRADFGELSEHELDHVFLLLVDKERIPLDRYNPEEIQDLRWVKLSDLEIWKRERPQDFTAWFFPAYALVEEKLKEEKWKQNG